MTKLSLLKLNAGSYHQICGKAHPSIYISKFLGDTAFAGLGSSEALLVRSVNERYITFPPVHPQNPQTPCLSLYRKLMADSAITLQFPNAQFPVVLCIK